MKCAKCGADVPAGAKFCAQCGGAIVASAAGACCSSCGRENKPENKFCSHCGKPLAAAPAIPPSHPPTTPTPADSSAITASPNGTTPAYPLPPSANVPPPSAPAAAPAVKERSGCCICGLIAAGLLAILLGLLGLAYWQGWLDKIIEQVKPKVGISMAELKAQGRSPVEVTKCHFNPLSSSVAIPNFTIAFRNISDRKIKAITAVMVLYDASGNLLKNWRQDTGYSEVEGIEPGDEVEGLQACSQKDAARAKVIIREVVYIDNPLQGKPGGDIYEVACKWTNPNFAKEIEAAIRH